MNKTAALGRRDAGKLTRERSARQGDFRWIGDGLGGRRMEASLGASPLGSGWRGGCVPALKIGGTRVDDGRVSLRSWGLRCQSS